MIVDRFGREVESEQAPRHRRAVGFTATTVPLREDEEVLHGIAPPKEYRPDVKREDHDPPVAR